MSFAYMPPFIFLIFEVYLRKYNWSLVTDKERKGLKADGIGLYGYLFYIYEYQKERLRNLWMKRNISIGEIYNLLKMISSI